MSPNDFTFSIHWNRPDSLWLCFFKKRKKRN